MATSSIEITASVKRYADEMRKLPGITDAQVAKAAKSMQRQLEAAQEKAAKAAQRAADDAAKAAAKAAMSLEDRLQVVAKTSSVLNGALGDLTGPLGDFGDLIGMVDMRTAALAVGATASVAAIVAMSAAVVGAGVHAANVARNWDEYVEAAGGATERTNEMEPAARAAAEALDALDRQVALASLSLSGSLAPVVESTVTAMSGAVAIAGDFAAALGTTTDSAAEAAIQASGYVTALAAQGPAAAAVVAPLALLQGAYEALNYYGGIRNEQLEDEQRLLADAAREAQFRIEQARAEASAMAALLGIPDQAPVAEDKQAQAEAKRRSAEAERLARQREAEAKRRAAEAERALETQRAAAEDLRSLSTSLTLGLLSDYDRIAGKRDATLAQIRELEAVSGDAETALVATERAYQTAIQETIDLRQRQADEFMRALERERAAREKSVEAEKEDIVDVAELRREYLTTQLAAADGVLANAQTVSDALTSMFDTQTEGGKKAYLALFKASKGIALADIAVKTGQAFMAALTVPPPAGPVLAVSALAAGAAQGIAAAAVQPRINHSGRVNMAADEAMTVVQRGEVVLSAPQVTRAGGPQAVADAVRRSQGTAPATPAVTLYADFTEGRAAVLLRRGARDRGDPFYGWAS